MDTEKMSLEELKNYYAKLKETLDNKYDNYNFFVTDDLDIFASEMCSECGGMKSASLIDVTTINPEVLAQFNSVTDLGEALGIDLLIATKTFDCECGMFFCENCGDNCDVEELYKEITVDGEKIYFCSEECYEEWKENNEMDSDIDEYEDEE